MTYLREQDIKCSKKNKKVCSFFYEREFKDVERLEKGR